MTHWIEEPGPEPAPDALPIVYKDDVMIQALDALETIAVASTESMQHQVYAEVSHSLALLPRMPPDLQARLAEIALSTVSGMGDLVLTGELDVALAQLIAAFEAAGDQQAAEAMQGARDDLAESLGRVNSRQSRVGR